MGRPLDILILGAAYGLLPAVRLALASHRVTVICREDEGLALVARGANVELRRRDGREGRTLHVAATHGRATAPGTLGVTGTDLAPDGFDMVFLAMGEPQYADPAVAALMAAIARIEVPVVSLMNLLPACFLRRVVRLDVDALKPAYAAWDVWQRFDPRRVTAASPDPQAVRLQAGRPDMLTVTLASNFKVAPFHDATDQALLEAVAASTARIHPDEEPAPARIVSHPSLTVPLSKWPMLITGNCRCLRPDGSVTAIGVAVRDRIEESRAIYELVARVVLAAGAPQADIVPFAAYAAAARQLTRPSSLARALHAGAQSVERIDLMVLHAARALGLPSREIEEVSQPIQLALERNRAANTGSS